MDASAIMPDRSLHHSTVDPEAGPFGARSGNWATVGFASAARRSLFGRIGAMEPDLAARLFGSPT